MSEQAPQRTHCLTPRLQEIEDQMESKLRSQMGEKEYSRYLQEKSRRMNQEILPGKKQSPA